MRAVSACLLFVLAAAVVSAQSCTAPSSDPLNPAGVTGCSQVTACQTSLCACTGSSSSSFPACLSTNAGSCSATQNCFAAYAQCLTAVTLQRSNTSNTGCSAYASSLYVAQLGAAAGTTAFNATALYGSCAYGICLGMNMTGNTASCSGSSITSAVCTSANLLGSATTSVPTTTVVTYDIVATFRLSGANWSYVLANATALAQLQTALQTDIAAVLAVVKTFIVIFNLSVGSLVVYFGVAQGSGKSPSQLVAGVNSAATSTTWLTSTGSVYSAVGTDSITVLSVGVNTTAAPTPVPPGQTTPTPTTPAPTSSAMSAAGVWAVAAVAAVAALFA